MATIHKALPIMLGQFLNFDVVGSIAQPTNPKENTIWVNTGTKVHHWSLNGKEPARVSNNKNLITYPYYYTNAFTTYGVTFTPASTGYITVNGTNSNTNYITCYIKHLTQVGSIHLSKGTYRLSGCPSGGSSSTYRLECAYSYNSGNNWTWIAEYGSGAQFTLTADAWVQVKIRIEKGVTMSSLVFKPQLERGTTATSFVKGDATGQVWVQTLNSDGIMSFNALKKNTIDVQVNKIFQWNGSKWNIMSGSIYQNGTNLPYKAQSDKYTITSSTSSENVIATSSTITNTEGYTKMVIDSVWSNSSGNYGQNWAKLYCNGVCVLSTGNVFDPGSYYSAISSWGGEFPISQNGTVYTQTWSDRDENRDDYHDACSVTVVFHFE